MTQLETPRGDGDGDGRIGVLAAISDEMVRLDKDQFGRGPNRVRTYWCGDDVVTTVLEETLTRAERNLVVLGEHQPARATGCAARLDHLLEAAFGPTPRSPCFEASIGGSLLPRTAAFAAPSEDGRGWVRTSDLSRVKRFDGTRVGCV